METDPKKHEANSVVFGIFLENCEETYSYMHITQNYAKSIPGI
jgi:hypothetical protein